MARGGFVSRLLARMLIGVVVSYQLVLRPLLVGACRFSPSCSEYAIAAIRIHGAWRGGWMALARIGRCRPGAAGGYDPVP